MIPTRVGQKCEGGYFTGVIREGATCYAIIVAPKVRKHQVYHLRRLQMQLQTRN